MKILIDINHPAHVHFFKYFIRKMKDKGAQLIVTASKKDICQGLLEEYGIAYIDLGSYGKSLFSKILAIFTMDYRMLKVVLKYKPDILMGIASFRVAHSAWLCRRKSLIFDDTEHSKKEIALYKPFATRIFTPSCFLSDLGRKQVRYSGYHELAYLHPDLFRPNPAVLGEIGLTESDQFFIVRFISWNAAHDFGENGFSAQGKNDLIALLRRSGRVFITSEKPLTKDLEPYRLDVSPVKIHDLLYYAQMYVGEGGTMATEAAILGTPSILVNSLTAGTFQELEKSYGLLLAFLDEKIALPKISNLLKEENLKSNWRQRRASFISDKINTTEFMIKAVEEAGKQ